MKKLMTIVVLLGSASAQTATPAKTTPATPPVKVSLAQDGIKTATVNGKAVETVVPSPKTVLPGDVLREEVTVTNVSTKVVRNSVISVPVPKGTVYAGNATPTGDRWNTVYSIDGGKTFTATPMKTVTVTENGKSVTKQVAAPANEYTNVRWVIAQLAADESLKLSFRVRVN
ncbi:hypothetical protein [Deinococcus aquiradiocola]|uniref:DUF11 domain-containing protein n=1 Tax=Deinococcus aquiradiocola TaxID=393059 RepID=A0A917UTV6_9DEIO|nr:hypothetical protein [Deinococcus aquiradiocola]GGJ85539.1 hypothetical protein GCM10008939_31740 [Deinococcus aquiradiocola]